MKKVLVLGGVSYDQIIYLNQLPEPKPKTIYSHGNHETIGSTGAGKAIALNNLGFEVTLHGLVGLDRYGELIKDKLNGDGIKFLCDIDPQGTERHVNLMDKDGRRISIYTNSATFNPNIEYHLMKKEIEKNDYIVLNIINYCRHYIPMIKEQKKLIWCDIHDYDGLSTYHEDFIQAADFLFMSSDCLDDYKSLMEKYIQQSKKIVICTHGKDGVSALDDGGNWYDLKVIEDYKRLDTNGAGDNFFSGFLYGYSMNYSVLKCLQLGVITSGLCITSKELVHSDLSVAFLEDEYQKYYS